jgi:site-specific DNA-methyltransferase (adenine-specific)
LKSWRRRARRSVHYSSKSYEWATPPEIYDPLHARYDFTLDACSTRDNAKCAQHFTKAEDGLTQIWTGRVWMNPPYGPEIKAWMRKAWESAQTTADLVVCLVPVRTDTRWWQEYVIGTGAEVTYLPGRIRFNGAPAGAPFPSAVVVFRFSKSETELGNKAG